MKRKPNDERDRLRELLAAYAKHTDVDAFRLEYAVQNDGVMRVVCTHSRGTGAEEYVVMQIVNLLRAMGVRVTDSDENPHNMDDLPKDEESAT